MSDPDLGLVVTMADESGLALENHQHVFSPGTSMESLTSIPEERATVSSRFHGGATSRRGSKSSLTCHHSGGLSKDPAVDARPWHTSLRRQNSAPQLERTVDKLSRSRQRLGSSDSVSSRSRHGSSESVNSDAGSRASRCPACCALSHDDADPFSSGRTSPAVGAQRRTALHRNNNSYGSDVIQSNSSFSAANQRQNVRHSSVNKSNSFGEADDAAMRNGPNSHLNNCNSLREMDSAHSHSGRRRSERMSVDECDLPGQHTARRLSERGSGNPDSHGQNSPRRRSERLSSNENDDPFDQTPDTARRRNARRPSNQHNAGQNTSRRKSEHSGIERQNSCGHPESHRTHQHNTDSAFTPNHRTARSGSNLSSSRAGAGRSKLSRKSSLGTADSTSKVRRRSDVEKLSVSMRRRSGYFDLDKTLEELRRAGGDAEKVNFDCHVFGGTICSVYILFNFVS